MGNVFAALGNMLVHIFTGITTIFSGVNEYAEAFEKTGQYTNQSATMMRDRAKVKNAAELRELSKQLENI